MRTAFRISHTGTVSGTSRRISLILSDWTHASSHREFFKELYFKGFFQWWEGVGSALLSEKEVCRVERKVAEHGQESYRWFCVVQHNREFILWRIDCTYLEHPNSIIPRVTVVLWFVWLFALKVFVVETWERCRPQVARVIVVWFRIIRFFFDESIAPI